MPAGFRNQMNLYAHGGGRKYLNGAERRRFLTAVQKAPPRVRLFCSLLVWSGSRVSEVLALTPAAVDLDDCLAVFETLKRRSRGISRQVPLPAVLVRDLDRVFLVRAMQADPELARRRLWPWSRTTAWRH